MKKKIYGEINTIVHVGREYGSLIGGGGLKDSLEGLCIATAKTGVKTHVFLSYPKNTNEVEKLTKIGEAIEFEVSLKHKDKHQKFERVKVSTYQDSKLSNLNLHLISSKRFEYLLEEELVKRENTYTYSYKEALAIGKPELFGEAYSDFFEMNVLLIKATLHALEKLNLKPDLIRCHDGHTALLPLIAKYSQDNFAAYLGNTPTLITIHNASDRYRSEIDYDDSITSLCNVWFSMLEPCIHNGKFEPILAAALFGTEIHTVSENYAREIQETGMDWHNSWIGHKLAGLGIKITGITHGVNPKKFSQLSNIRKGKIANNSLSAQDLEEKKKCKQQLLKELGFDNATIESPLLTFVGRFAYQKGFLTLAHVIQELFAQDKDILLVANGSGYWEIIEQINTALGSKFKDRLHIVYEYDPQFANKILLAGDFCIIPSLFEPCGQIDFIAQLNGNIPIVHGVGGLVKVEHGVTGFSYLGRERELFSAIKEAIEIYRNDKERLREIQRKAVERIVGNFTWDKVYQQRYLPLYKKVIEKAKPILPYN